MTNQNATRMKILLALSLLACFPHVANGNCQRYLWFPGLSVSGITKTSCNRTACKTKPSGNNVVQIANTGGPGGQALFNFTLFCEWETIASTWQTADSSDSHDNSEEGGIHAVQGCVCSCYPKHCTNNAAYSGGSVWVSPPPRDFRYPPAPPWPVGYPAEPNAPGVLPAIPPPLADALVTSSPPPPRPPTTTQSPAGLSSAAIAGIVVGSVCGPLLIGGILWIVYRRRRASRAASSSSRKKHHKKHSHEVSV